MISIKTHHFHSFISLQEQFFYRKLITSHICPTLWNSSGSSLLQMLFKIAVLKSFGNFTGEHLCQILFLKNLQAHAFLLKKDTNKGVSLRSFWIRTLAFQKQFFFIYFNESPLKMMKNAFCFILKAPFVFKIFKILSWLFGHVEDRV